MASTTVAILEPFACSSHAHLMRWIPTALGSEAHIVQLALPGKKWHWRLGASSMWAAQNVPLGGGGVVVGSAISSSSSSFSSSSPSSTTSTTSSSTPTILNHQNRLPLTLFASSMTNLAELVALRPDLAGKGARKVYYMHENQLVYPSQKLISHPTAPAPTNRGSNHNTQHPTSVTLPPPTTISSSSSVAAVEALSTLSAVGILTSSPTTTTTTTITTTSSAAHSNSSSTERDFHLGWAQVLSCLVSDVVAWNSSFNLESFLSALPAFIRMMPDKAQRPDVVRIIEAIRARSVIVPLPVDVPAPSPLRSSSSSSSFCFTSQTTNVSAASTSSSTSSIVKQPLIIGWNHRWEYDKEPALFFNALQHLVDAQVDFRVVVLGEKFAEYPPVFDEAFEWLSKGNHIQHWGYAPDRASYLSLLHSCDVVVSTASHEFFGVAMLEAASVGAFPLAPCDLAYPESLAPTNEETLIREHTLHKIKQLTSSSEETLGSARCFPFSPPPAFPPAPQQQQSEAKREESEGGCQEVSKITSTSDLVNDPSVTSSNNNGSSSMSTTATPSTLSKKQKRNGDQNSNNNTNDNKRSTPYKPALRQSAHLYNTQAQLCRSLLRFAKDPRGVREWKQQMIASVLLVGGEGGVGDGKGYRKDVEEIEAQGFSAVFSASSTITVEHAPKIVDDDVAVDEIEMVGVKRIRISDVQKSDKDQCEGDEGSFLASSSSAAAKAVVGVGGDGNHASAHASALPAHLRLPVLTTPWMFSTAVLSPLYQALLLQRKPEPQKMKTTR